jgi:hypothetical protein
VEINITWKNLKKSTQNQANESVWLDAMWSKTPFNQDEYE